MGDVQRISSGASFIDRVKTTQAIVESHGEKSKITNPGEGRRPLALVWRHPCRSISISMCFNLISLVCFTFSYLGMYSF